MTTTLAQRTVRQRHGTQPTKAAERVGARFESDVLAHLDRICLRELLQDHATSHSLATVE